MLTSKQIEEILARKPLKRYRYFVRVVAQEEVVWSLADEEEGWLLMDVAADTPETAFVVFPHEAFAERFRNQSGFETFRVTAIDLYEYMEWLDDFASEKIRVAVFPSPDLEGAVIAAEELKNDLLSELKTQADAEQP